MQGAVVVVVDLPRGNPGIAVADVFTRANGLIQAQHSVRCICAGVDLFLNEEGNEVDEVGSDGVASNSNCQIDQHVEKVHSASSL